MSADRDVLSDHWARLTEACVEGGFRDAHETEVVSLWAHGEIARLRAERDRAVETRENANAATLRVEHERDGLRAERKTLRAAAVDLQNRVLELARESHDLRAENETLKRSWCIDADHRDTLYAALTGVWGDMRYVEKHHVPNEVLALVREAIGSDLDPHDPAFSGAIDEQEATE